MSFLPPRCKIITPCFLFTPSSSSFSRFSFPERNRRPHTCTQPHGIIVHIRLPIPALPFVPSLSPVHSHCSHSTFSTDRTSPQVRIKVLFFTRAKAGAVSHMRLLKSETISRRAHTPTLSCIRSGPNMYDAYMWFDMTLLGLTIPSHGECSRHGFTHDALDAWRRPCPRTRKAWALLLPPSLC